MKKTFLGIGVLLVILIIFIIINKRQTDLADREVINIGLVAPLSGDAAPYGEPVTQGVRLAVEELNNRNNSNYHYRIIAEDGKCSGGPAASAAQKLVNIDKVKYIIGGSCSGENLAMAPITEPARVLVISPFASSPELSSAGPYTYRTAPSDVESGIFIGNYLKDKYQNIAILSENTDFAQAAGEQVIKTFVSGGGNVSINESFQSQGENFMSQVLKIKNSNAEAIFINPQSETNLIGILRQLQEQQVSLPTIGFFLTSDTVAQSPYSKYIIMVDAPNISTNKGKKFEESFVAMFNKQPSFPFAAAAAYDAMYLLSEGIEKNGNTQEDVKTYWDGIKNYNGVSGTFSFDENGDPKGHRYVLKRVQDGKFVEVNR